MQVLLPIRKSSGLHYKSFMIVIYKGNDSGQCYKTFTVVSYKFFNKLALAWIIN